MTTLLIVLAILYVVIGTATFVFLATITAIVTGFNPLATQTPNSAYGYMLLYAVGWPVFWTVLALGRGK